MGQWLEPQDYSEALWARYRSEPLPDIGPVPPEVAHLLTHRSVRRYLPEPVTEQQVAAMVAAAQSASTSSNLQLWTVIEVRDEHTKAHLAEVATGMADHIATAPVVLVWVADLGRAFAAAEELETSTDAAEYLETTLVAFGDAMIAAQNAAVAAEAMGLGICYLGSLRNDVPATAEILGLPEHCFAAVGMTVGWPDPADTASVKARMAQPAVWHKERYDVLGQRAAVDNYEEAVATYYQGQGLAPSWKARLARRIGDIAALAGRERMSTWLDRRGMGFR